MAKKTIKAKKFLNPVQIKTLKEKGWKVRSSGTRIKLYEDEFKYDVWEQMCELVGVDPTSTSCITLLTVGVRAEEE